MRNKSKFLTFLLSFIPGISHFYLGYPDKGAIYLFLFAGFTIGTVVLGFLTGSEIFLLMLFVGVAFIWLIALIDAFSTFSHMPYYKADNSESELQLNEQKEDNKKIITLGLSIIPGAGHMYLGYQKRGLLFMATFLFSVFFMGWLNLSFLLFLLPLIWFYSFFDAYHILNGGKIEEIDMFNLLPKIKEKHIGIGLIALGILIVVQKILYPIIAIYLDYQIRNYIQTSIVALIFIIVGIKILTNKRETKMEVPEENEEKI